MPAGDTVASPRLFELAGRRLGVVVKADLPEAAYWASLSYLNTRDDPENLKIVDPYYRSVLNKLTYEQKLQLVERLERQVRQD
ncbi:MULTISPECIES: hypothetical protein [unclassified Ensifer]|uniref:hypothetical protein n=1 Tax=unclassified Ensifer TaxID=2633371 RepID=UPI000813AF09|nr:MULTISPECIES: hypothetical protein [unclassified Ensifer]OCO98899.1 hypothetical protein BC362_27035 [Ensifer sp. LC14]OCP04432.1 hypothetical protein BBX50_25660 [Ensifer sp. LC11]OCP04713.1 hypothetical protein BC374_25680 [Ensifer sp. LC13]OCP30537.1 hypothetical protein BC364_25695 [Ensifer sp. LC499]